jgi:hypothetical protein
MLPVEAFQGAHSHLPMVVRKILVAREMPVVERVTRVLITGLLILGLVIHSRVSHPGLY